MCPPSNGSGEELEKFPDATAPPVPTSIAISVPGDVPDAGLRSLDHYKRRLPPWRYKLRQRLLPIIRWETPYLAWMQEKMRTPALDSYFAITANLGTHTFFMIFLPILFWCGHTSLGRGMVHILATGVFFTGFLKDMLSLPRPLSPPLHRITMSGSAALEYGFPSTHSANAVSVAVYTLFSLHSPDCTLQPTTRLILESLSYFYAFSIVLGRLYCGMHGFFDVIVGSIMGALLSVIECVYGAAIDKFLHSGSWVVQATVAAAIIVLIRIHPEPADDCPCFDDSVAFAGVMIGLELGSWHYASGEWGWDDPVPATVPFDLAHLGWTVVILRIVFGVLTIFAWREIMKPTLLKSLPHVFRVIDKLGLILPRKFFMPASEYKKIPSQLKVDNVMPNVSDLPQLLTTIRHPGRGRAVSIGPQSVADAYETMAYRERRRHESLKGQARPDLNAIGRSVSENDQSPGFVPGGKENNACHVSGASPLVQPSSMLGNMVPSQSKVSAYEQMMGTGEVLVTPTTPPQESYNSAAEGFPDLDMRLQTQMEDREMFSRLEKPRVRYDVEVVTKLVVYAGIAWLAVEVNPMVFEIVGLGMGGYMATR